MEINPVVCVLPVLVTCEIVAVEVLSFSGARKEGCSWVFGLVVAYTFGLTRVYLIHVVELRDRGRAYKGFKVNTLLLE